MKKVFRAYLDCIVDCFGAAYDDREPIFSLLMSALIVLGF